LQRPVNAGPRCLRRFRQNLHRWLDQNCRRFPEKRARRGGEHLRRVRHITQSNEAEILHGTESRLTLI
jgi:hypothetical protein